MIKGFAQKFNKQSFLTFIFCTIPFSTFRADQFTITFIYAKKSLLFRNHAC